MTNSHLALARDICKAADKALKGGADRTEVSFVLLQSVIALLTAEGQAEKAGQFLIAMGEKVKAGMYPADLAPKN